MKKLNKKKLIILIAVIAVVLITAVTVTVVLIKRNNKQNGAVASATKETLEILKDNANILYQKAEEYYCAEDCQYDYPQNKVLRVEVNNLGYMVATYNGWSADKYNNNNVESEINTILSYAGFKQGEVFIGLTNVVYDITFSKGKNVSIKETEKVNTNDITVITGEIPQESESTTPKADEGEYKNNAIKILEAAKSHFGSSAPSDLIIMIYSDYDYNIHAFATEDKYQEDVDAIIAASGIGDDYFMGDSDNVYQIKVENGKLVLYMNNGRGGEFKKIA